MKRKLICVLAIAAALSVSGCSNVQQTTSADGEGSTTTDAPVNQDEDAASAEETVKQLFDENLYCNSIFSISSLEYSGDPVDGDLVYKVSDDAFADYAAFESYVRSVYSSEQADTLLNNYPYENDPKYVNVNGDLCINTAHAGGKGYFVDWTDYSLIINSADDSTIGFTVTGKIAEPADEPVYEDYIVEGSAVFEDGEWKLANMLY